MEEDMKLRILAVILILICTTTLFADLGANLNLKDGLGKRFLITLYPFSIINRAYSGEAEIVLIDYLSIAFEAIYKGEDTGFNVWKNSETSMGPGVRIYPFGTAPVGFFVAPYYAMIDGTAKYSYTGSILNTIIGTSDYSGYSLTMWFGARTLIGSYLTVEFAAGLSMLSLDTEDFDIKDSTTGITYDTVNYDEEYNDKQIRLSLGMGLAF
jgi:hypothetical protein